MAKNDPKKGWMDLHTTHISHTKQKILKKMTFFKKLQKICGSSHIYIVYECGFRNLHDIIIPALRISVSHKGTNVVEPRFTPRNHAPGHIKSQIFWNF